MLDRVTTDALPSTRWLSAREQAAWRSYLRSSRALFTLLDRELAEHHLSLAEYEALSMLSEAPGRRLRMSALADIVVQSRSRLTHTAKRLELRGLVERVPVPDDKRGVELVLLEEGLQVLRDAARVHVRGVREHLVDVMEAAEFQELGRLSQKVSEHLDELA